MDKFVVRTARGAEKPVARAGKPAQLKQSTLHSLAGVVVLEDLQRARQQLESHTESEETKCRLLRQLREKRPAKEVLVKIGIGRTVRKLSKEAESSEVRRLSGAVYRAWRRELERKVELSTSKQTVRSDKETERVQRAAVTQLGLALAVHLGPGPATTSLAEQLERAIRQKTAGLVGASYRKRARKLVFALKGSGEVCSQLQAGSLAPADLLSHHQ